MVLASEIINQENGKIKIIVKITEITEITEITFKTIEPLEILEMIEMKRPIVLKKVTEMIDLRKKRRKIMIKILIEETTKKEKERIDINKKDMKRKRSIEEIEIQWWRSMKWTQDKKTWDS